jgi:hypothetical protein
VLIVGALSCVACSSPTEPREPVASAKESSGIEVPRNIEKPAAETGFSTREEASVAFHYRVLSAWGNSPDGAVSVRIYAPTAVQERQDAIEVYAELRNNSTSPLFVKKPLADPSGFEIVGPLADVLDLDRAEPLVASRSLHEIVQPGESVGDQLRIPLKKGQGRDAPGRNRLRFAYRVTAADQRAAEDLRKPNLWTGEVVTGFVVVTRGIPQNPAEFEKNVAILFQEPNYTFSLADVAKGVAFEYDIVCHQDIASIIPIPQDMGHAAGGGPSGLIPFEEITGNGQRFALDDVGLAPGIRYESIRLRKGRYRCSFEWRGRNWNGPSDTGNKEGPPFPAGEYTLTVRLFGFIDTAEGREVYRLARSIPVVLTP